MSTPTATTVPAKSSHMPERIRLISYPKIVFLYPAYLVAIVAGFYSLWNKDPASAGAHVVAWTFLITLSLNLVVLSFDFPRTSSITLFFLVVAAVLGVALASVYMENLLPRLGRLLDSINPAANAPFYLLFAGVMTLIYGGVWIHARFDYWEVRSNELLHHHGFMSDLERFPAPQLKIDKEVRDVFEYMLLGAGRLILHPSNERRAIVLENVLRIGKKEKAITQLLGAMQVRVRTDEEE
jgi:hypothetical protein